MRALIIDRDRANARAVGKWLEEIGFAVETAKTAVQARVGLRRIRPTLVALSPAVLDLAVDGVLENLRRVGRMVVLRVQDGLPAHSGDCAGYGSYDPDLLVVSGQPRRVVGAAGMIGESPALGSTYARVLRVARTDTPVFVFGETGTGKELVARAIHELGPRSRGPFVAVNCGAVPRDLFESELFGHEGGSFTGACGTRRGRCEQAHGGTLFLDELAEMPVDLQVKLLRVLERGELTRVGGERRVSFNARIIAATNRSPAHAVKEGVIREDLYHRLFVFPIEIPPLRERGGDVALLAEFSLARQNREAGTSKRLSARSRRSLGEHRWPGNVRELQNAVKRAFILGRDSTEIDVMPMNWSSSSFAARARLREFRVGMTIAELERMLIEATLELVGGNKPEAARTLGVSLKTVYNRLAVYGEERQEEAGDTGHAAASGRVRAEPVHGHEATLP